MSECSDDSKESLDKLLTYQSAPEDTAAIIFESVQGECGIKSINTDFLKYAERLCNEHNIMMILMDNDQIRLFVTIMNKYNQLVNISSKELDVKENADGPVSAADLAVNSWLLEGFKSYYPSIDWIVLSEENLFFYIA